MTQTIVQGSEDPLLVLDHQGGSGNPSFEIQQDETAVAFIFWDQVNQVFNMGPASVGGPSLSIASDGTVSMGNTHIDDLLVGIVLVNGGIVVNQDMNVRGTATINGLVVQMASVTGMEVDNGNITNMTAGELVVQNGASVTGGLQVDNGNTTNMTAGELVVQHGASVTGGMQVDALLVQQTATLPDAVVDGNLGVAGNIGVDGGIVVQQDAVVDGGIEVQQDALVGGNLVVTGDIAAANLLFSLSGEIKDNIIDLSNQEALDVLEHLSPVKFNYKADDAKKAVASSDGKGISLTDIVSVLTRVVREQQKTINALSEKCHSLELAMNRALS
jgi:hypothetical protein